MAAPTIEGGVFLFFGLFPILMFFFWSKLVSWGIIGYLCFFVFGLAAIIMMTGLALIMEGGYVVQATNNVDAFNSTVTTPTYVVHLHQISGATVTDANTTYPVITTTTVTPAHSDHSIWINTNQSIWGYLFIGFTVFLSLVWIYVLYTTGWIVMMNLIKKKSPRLEAPE